jgi:hypothetical protein
MLDIRHGISLRSEAFASLFSVYILQDYRQKKPLGTSIPSCATALCLKFMSNGGKGVVTRRLMEEKLLIGRRVAVK